MREEQGPALALKDPLLVQKLHDRLLDRDARQLPHLLLNDSQPDQGRMKSCDAEPESARHGIAVSGGAQLRKRPASHGEHHAPGPDGLLSCEHLEAAIPHLRDL